MIKMFSLIILIYLLQIGNSAIVNIPGLGTISGSVAQSEWTNRTIHRFLGIPYAEPPVDQLRFKVFFLF